MDQNVFYQKMKKTILITILSLSILVIAFLITLSTLSTNKKHPQQTTRQAAASSVFDFDNATEIKTGVWQIPNFSNYQEFHILSPKGLEIFASIVNDENGGASGYDSFKGEKVFLKTDIHYENPITINIGDVVGGNNHIFLGNFDGENHTISNIIIGTKSYRPSSDTYKASSGFFSYFRGELKNLNLTKVAWGGPWTDVLGNWYVHYVAGLVGYIDSAQINNCSISEFEMEGKYDVFYGYGGLIGVAVGSYSITDCKVSNVILSGGGNCSGLIAYAIDDATIVGCEVSNSTFKGGICCGITGNKAGNLSPDSIIIQECAIKNVTLNGSYALGSSGLISFPSTLYLHATILDVFIDINPESNLSYLVGNVMGGTYENVVIRTSDTSIPLTPDDGKVTLDNVVKTKDWSNFNVDSVGGEGAQLSKWYNGEYEWNDGWIYPRRLIEWETLQFKPRDVTISSITPDEIEVPRDAEFKDRRTNSGSIVLLNRNIKATLYSNYTATEFTWEFDTTKTDENDTFKCYVKSNGTKTKVGLSFSKKIYERGIKCEGFWTNEERGVTEYFNHALDVYLYNVSTNPNSWVLKESVFTLKKDSTIEIELECYEKEEQEITISGKKGAFLVYKSITFKFSYFDAGGELTYMEIKFHIEGLQDFSLKNVLYCGHVDDSQNIVQPLSKNLLKQVRVSGNKKTYEYKIVRNWTSSTSHAIELGVAKKEYNISIGGEGLVVQK